MPIALALIALLATAQLQPCCPDDDGDDAPAAASVERAPDPLTGYGTIRMDEEPLQVWLDLGYGSVTERYDEDGDTKPLQVFEFRGPNNEIDSTVNRNVETASLTLQFGGVYDVFRIAERSNMQLGAELNLARHTLTADSLLLADTPRTVRSKRDLSSSLTPQNLTLSAALDAPRYTLRASYLFDLGPTADNIEINAGDYWNSDQRDALRLDAVGRFASGVGYRLTGGASYVATTTRDNSAAPRPDVLRLKAGLSFRSSDNFEVGAMLLSRSELPSLLHDEDSDSIVFSDGLTGFLGPLERGRVLSVVPYAAYHAEDAPLQLRIKAGFQGEYFDYGYSFWGRDEIAPGLGVTAGITYGIL
jgi:hypothetical protein